MWWDLTFDPQSQIVLSCAPDWAKDGDIKQMVIYISTHFTFTFNPCLVYHVSNPKLVRKCLE